MRQETANLLNGKTTVSKLSRSEQNGENGKRFSGGRSGSFEARTMLSTIGGKLKGGSPPQPSRQEDQAVKAEEPCPESVCKEEPNSKMDRENNESQKRKCPEGDVLLQWGQRRRQRHGRVEAKPSVVAEDQKKTIRVDRRVRAEKQNGSAQLQSPPISRTHAVRSCAAAASQDNGCNPSRRNSEGCNGLANGGSSHSPNSDERNHRTVSGENKLDRHSSPSPDGPEEGPAGISGGCNGHSDMDIGQERPMPAEKVNLELFEWPKFLIALSRKEKEDDFLAIKGSKLPQRPKKRSKHIEKTLHYVSPGMWLCDLTRERYEVREKKAIKKKPRGLKAMGSMDSDSE